jgi:hypothetical protein
MHPPPPTAWLIGFATPFNNRFTALLLKVLIVIDTDGASTVPIAPPHAEHAVVAFGQVAMLF